MKLRCRIGWHRYDHHVAKVVFGVRITQDNCECGAYRNFTWAVVERSAR